MGSTSVLAAPFTEFLGKVLNASVFFSKFKTFTLPFSGPVFNPGALPENILNPAHTNKNTIININKYYSLCTACGRIANSEHSLYWSVETTGHNDSTSPPIMPHDVLSVTNQKVG